MTTTYSIDTGDGNELCAGLQGYDYARRVAQERANKLGENVYLYAPSEVTEAEERGEEHESEEIEPAAVRCECGAATGHRCTWVGPASETVIVEWMPEHLRESHTAAHNRGTYPHNGARRLTVHVDCADSLCSDDEWCERVEASS